MMLTWLADAIRATGVNVVEEPGWQTRSQYDYRHGYRPIGVMVHHTAPPVPYPVAKLYRSCNLNVKQNGTVHVIAAGYEYDSGRGSSVVLAETRAGIAPKGDARARGLIDNTDGNPYYIDIEVDHAGDGRPIPQVQYDALIRTIAAICEHQDWTVGHIIGHREWTKRKPDPRWLGDTNPMPAIRTAVAGFLAGEGLGNEGDDMVIGQGYPNEETIRQVQLKLHDAGYGALVGKIDSVYGPKTTAGVSAFQKKTSLPITGTVDWITALHLGILGSKGPKGDKGDPGPLPKTIRLELTAKVVD